MKVDNCGACGSDPESLDELTKKVVALEKRVAKAEKLRYDGLYYGARGVRFSMFFIASVFACSAFLAIRHPGVEFFSPVHLIVLIAVVALALIAYFGFIFQYSVKARVSKSGVRFGTDQIDPNASESDDPADPKTRANR